MHIVVHDISLFSNLETCDSSLSASYVFIDATVVSLILIEVYIHVYTRTYGCNGKVLTATLKQLFI